MARTGFAYSQKMLLHDTGPLHPESPMRLEAILRALDRAQLDLEILDVEPATREDLLRVHTAEHVATIERTCANNWIYPDPDTPMVRASWTAALLAAGGAITACKAVLDGQIDNAFCAVRPPGHHAEADRAMGFCLFNNVAIAARWLQNVAGVPRVAILDWDVHHGNGTQNTFYDDTTVYYASLHQSPHFPMTGNPEERGGDGTNLNVPMSPGCGPDEWLGAIQELVEPEFERFRPDFLLISSGFDGHRADPLGAQMLESDTYGEMTRRMCPLAQGRIVSVLEGGYHLPALGESIVEHVRALLDAPPAGGG